MRANVFTDSALARYAGQFVWLSIDIEKASNAPLLKKLTIEGVPSFFVLDGKTEKVAFRWLGSATVAQFGRIFDDALRAVGGSRDRTKEMLARADRLYAEGKNAEAAKAYQETLAAAPPGWPSYGRATESLLFAQQASGEFPVCVATALKAYPKLKNTASASNVASVGLDCALSLPAENPDRAKHIAALETASREVLGNPKVKIAADDRSGIYTALIAARDDAKDTAGKRRTTEEWAAFLEKEAAAARTPDQRAVYDSHRLSAYLELEAPERAIPMLQQSERDLPGDYNPPARLAVAYNAMKQYADALAASDRALAKAYGPRKLGILQTRADIYFAMGEKEEAQQTMSDAIALAESPPEGQRSDKRIAALKKKLEGMK